MCPPDVLSGRKGTAVQPLFSAFLILSRCFCSGQKLGHLQNQNCKSLGKSPGMLSYIACDKANDKEIGMKHSEPFCCTSHILLSSETIGKGHSYP